MSEQTVDEVDAEEAHEVDTSEHQTMPDTPVLVVIGGDEPIRAVVLDAEDRVVGHLLVPADYETSDPATRWRPETEGHYLGLLEEGEDPPLGARLVGGTWEHPEPSPEPEPVLTPEPVQDTLRRDVDAVLALLLSAQAGGAEPTEHDWPAIIGGLIARGTAGATEITGAVAWRLLDDAQADDLHHRLP